MPPTHHDVSQRMKEVDGRISHPLLTSKSVPALRTHRSSTDYELHGWGREVNRREE